jgi:S1-C subfamily serine protease
LRFTLACQPKLAHVRASELVTRVRIEPATRRLRERLRPSARFRAMHDTSQLQISAGVQPGNSGGPLLDSDGFIVGVVVSKLDAIAVANAIGDIPQNINFAIRAELAEVFPRSQRIEPRVVPTALRKPAVADLVEAARSYTFLVKRDPSRQTAQQKADAERKAAELRAEERVIRVLAAEFTSEKIDVSKGVVGKYFEPARPPKKLSHRPLHLS